jgi:hypothetical protein
MEELRNDVLRGAAEDIAMEFDISEDEVFNILDSDVGSYLDQLAQFQDVTDRDEEY